MGLTPRGALRRKGGAASPIIAEGRAWADGSAEIMRRLGNWSAKTMGRWIALPVFRPDTAMRCFACLGRKPKSK